MAKTTSTLTMHTRFPLAIGGTERPGWCREHQDFAWLYDDGSVQCLWATSVETGTSGCDVVAGRLLLPRGVVKRRMPRKAGSL